MQWLQVCPAHRVHFFPFRLVSSFYLRFRVQSELSFEYRPLQSNAPSVDKRSQQASKKQRHQNQSVTVNFPLIHFDCALSPAAPGKFPSL
jgi:hypothetical protein